MSVLDYENMRKWGRWFIGRPLWLKGVLIVGVIVLLIGWVCLRGRSIENLKSKNERLAGEIDSLRSRSAELHRENLHYKELLDPIRQKAEQLYPALETDAALAKLAEDIKEVRELAESDTYKPLSPELKGDYVSLLQRFKKEYAHLNMKISVTSDKGIRARQKVAEEIADILIDAGFEAEATAPIIRFTKDTSDICIKLNPDDADLVKDVYKILKLFMNGNFSVLKNENFERGELQIIISGDPLFSPNGTVKFP